MKPADYYRAHSPMTDPGRHSSQLTALPDDVSGIAHALQGLCIYDVVSEMLYGFAIPAKRAGEINIRRVDEMIDIILALDSRPLDVERQFGKRLVSRCNHYALLLVATLRAKGVPARVRGGYAAYFNAPAFEDHWVAECWNADEQRWIVADAQLDAVWLEKMDLKCDPLDLPPDQFVTSAEAWRLCRSGTVDPQRFGISFADLRGLWFVGCSLQRDTAALAKAEMLPWDFWGAQPQPNAVLSPDEIAFFDRLANLTASPDAHLDEIRTLYASDARLKVGGEVFNALTQRLEQVDMAAAA